ncbi:MAG: FAD-dependent monooxygenase, partial [Pseudomonadota bacterium]
DGRDSPLVRAARIPVRRWQYGQRALVFPVTHADPHANLSTEFHRPGGPLVLVPLPDIEGRPASSVVWLNRTPRAHALAAMDDGDLAAALTAETMGRFGPLTVAGPRAEWPIVSQLAARLTAERLALVGEPAHVVPPTGAQGANLSVADAETLTEVLAAARAAGEDIGSPAVLARYQRRRWPEIAARVAGIDTLNRAVDSASPAVIAARSLGIDLMDRIAPLRRLTMRAGLGGTTLAEAAEGVLAPLRRAAAASARHGFARKP